MNRFRIGDIVVYDHNEWGKVFPPVYVKITDVIEGNTFSPIREDYYFGVDYDIASDKILLDYNGCPTYRDFWAHEVELVDMKGANI